MARSIFVADDDKTAERYATEEGSPYRYYYSQLYTKLKKGRLDLFKTRRDQPDHAIGNAGFARSALSRLRHE